ncbi:MAG: hemerythrin domain-containing protein [Burkholderiaceae bacterium]|nr:hemerythrin domain-containing protein [Burkholderiaceae bacterium]
MKPSALQVIRNEHAALAAMLRSLDMMIVHGPGGEPERFFDVVRAMLFYIDEFPERRHHPKESERLFPRLVKAAPELAAVIDQLEDDHQDGERKVRELQHQLLAWELLGETRRQAFVDAAREYVRFYLEHMRIEESRLLPVAEKVLTATDRAELDAAFAKDPDPLASDDREGLYERLFSRIVTTAPDPVGLGRHLG